MRDPSRSSSPDWPIRLVVASLIALAMTGTVAAEGWQATRVQGIVLLLQDDAWSDLANGTKLPERTTLRTLGRSKVEIVGTGVELFLYNGAATELAQTGTQVQMVLHAGSVDLRVLSGHAVQIRTASGSISLAEGRVRIWRAGDVTRIDDIAGDHEVFDTAGNCTRLSAGQTAQVSATGVTIIPTGDS